MSQIIIRKAGKEDAQAIALMESKYIEVAWTENQIISSMDSGLYDFYLAESGGNVVGYAFVQWCLDEGNLCNVCTDEKFRHLGVATRILNIMHDEAKAKGVTVMLLEVNERNLGAIALYEKLGYKVLYKRPNYYGSDSALIMQKTI